MKATVYEIITSQMIEKLESGIIPWSKPWTTSATGEFPKNLKSKKEYRGVNLFILSMSGYSNPYWVTLNQCKEMGGWVMEPDKYTMVVFWRPIKKTNELGEEEMAFMAPRYYKVYNVEQCSGLEVPTLPAKPEKTPVEKLEACEELVRNFKDCPPINHGGDRAYYSPSADQIQLPLRDQFISSENYYATLFHEMGHSTGHEKRLNRKSIGVSKFGSADYSREELVAEMTSAFLCNAVQILKPVQDNTVAYLQGWLKALKADSKAIFIAAGQAQKAFEYIVGKEEIADEEE